MRHSEAVGAGDLLDKDRPLSNRGIVKCQEVANYLNEISDYPDLILSSSSLRTTQTVENIFKNIDLKIKAVFMDELYYGHPGDIFEIIKNIDEQYSKVLLVSHNPAISNLALMLADQISGKEYFALQKFFDTADIVKYDLKHKNWRDIRLSEGKILWHFKC